MNKRYRLVVFDWEGTLSDALGPILHCVSTEAARLNFGTLDEQLARQSVDLGLVNALKKVFPHLTLTQHEQLLDAVQQTLLTKPMGIYLVPGAIELIEYLNGEEIFLAIASNKGQQSLQKAVQHAGLDVYFKVLRSGEQVEPKPSPAMLREILQEFAVEPKDALMIGDSLSDIEMAQSLGVDAIGVDFYKTRCNFKAAGAIEVFSDYGLLKDYLQVKQGKSS